jgi:two-component system response regulator NreC
MSGHAAVGGQPGNGAEDGIRIVLADDHAVVRSALRMLLDSEQGFTVVGEAGNLDTATQLVLDERPAVLVLDLSMPGRSTLEAIPTLREQAPDTHIVVLTMQDQPEVVREALTAGAAGYVVKDAADAELVEAVRRAAVGEIYLNPRLGAQMARAAPAAPVDDLTEREVQVLRLIALGHTSAEIAAQLYVSVRTVEAHRAHIQKKLGVRTRAELVRHALSRGLLADH